MGTVPPIPHDRLVALSIFAAADTPTAAIAAAAFRRLRPQPVFRLRNPSLRLLRFGSQARMVGETIFLTDAAATEPPAPKPSTPAALRSHHLAFHVPANEPPKSSPGEERKRPHEKHPAPSTSGEPWMHPAHDQRPSAAAGPSPTNNPRQIDAAELGSGQTNCSVCTEEKTPEEK